MHIIAHAGLMGSPANSLASIDTAIKAGVHGMEFDLRCSRDGLPFFSHDRILFSPEGKSRYLDRLTGKELMSGGYISAAGHRPPSMDEVLRRLAAHSLIMNLDVKDPAALTGAFEQLSEYWAGRCFFTGLSADQIRNNDILLQRGRERGIDIFVNLPGTRIGQVRDWEGRFLMERIDGVNLEYPYLNDVVVDLVGSRFLKTAVWTVDEPVAMERMMRFGCDYITTNRPDLVRVTDGREA